MFILNDIKHKKQRQNKKQQNKKNKDKEQKMALTNLGQINGAGDELALFKDIFTGEVLSAYAQNTILDNILMNKTISGGKSASFKNTGKLSTSRHSKGATVVGGEEFTRADTIINVEDRVYITEAIAEIDELMDEKGFNARTAITTEMGVALANQKDTDRIKEIIKGSRASNVISGLPGGSQVTNADLASADKSLKSAAIKSSITFAVQTLKEKNVTGEIYVLVRPAEYMVLANDLEVTNKDYTNNNGGIDTGKVLYFNGAKILESNNLVKEDSSVSDTYHGVDASNTYGIAFTKDAVATVNLLGVNIVFDEKKDEFATKVISSYIAGHGTLRPEACVEFISA